MELGGKQVSVVSVHVVTLLFRESWSTGRFNVILQVG